MAFEYPTILHEHNDFRRRIELSLLSLCTAGLGLGYVPDFLAAGKKDFCTVDLGVARSRYDIILRCSDTVEHSRSVKGFVNELSLFFPAGHVLSTPMPRSR